MDRSLISALLDEHRKHPDVSLADHVSAQRTALGRRIASKKKIYLDTRIWVLMREVALGREASDSTVALHDVLQDAVASGVAVCPVSDAVFLELMKQSDQETRFATATLIDQLSLGVSFITFNDRVRQELCNHVYTSAGAKDLEPVEHLVWTKVSSILGEAHQTNTPFDAEEELAVQKAFYDFMWNGPLLEAVRMINQQEWQHLPSADTAEKLNLGKHEHTEDARSFEHLRKIEFYGGFDLFQNDLGKLLREVDERGINDWPSRNQKLSESKAFKKLRKALPTLDVYGCCHAEFRWDKGRKFRPNDFMDFHHATAAIPYCDLLLTETDLAQLVTKKHMGLMDAYECAVFSDLAAAAGAISDMTH